MRLNMSIFFRLITILAILPCFASAQEDGLEQFAEDRLAAKELEAPFRPRVIIMSPSVLFFEEGWGFSVEVELAQEIIEQAYQYVSEYLNKDLQDSRDMQNNQLILATIQQERPLSSAQVFARQNASQRYLYINIFPTRSITNHSQLHNQLWRAKRNTSPAFWRVRYDLDKQQFFGFSHDFLA